LEEVNTKFIVYNTLHKRVFGITNAFYHIFIILMNTDTCFMTANTQRVTFKIQYRFETRRVLFYIYRTADNTYFFTDDNSSLQKLRN